MRRFAPVWVFILIFAIVIIYLPGLSKYLKLKRKDADLESEVFRLRNEITRLKEEEHLIKTDLTRLEQVVREELGLVKPGEIVYKVVEEQVPAKNSKPSEKNPVKE